MNVRRAVKQVAATGLCWSGAQHVVATARRSLAGGTRVVVLGYHRVCTDFEREAAQAIDSCLISRATFDRHVAFLAERFELVTMTRAVDVLQGRAHAEGDVAAITFDDGYADVLENALPVLNAHDAPATMYVSSDVVARQRHFPHDRLYTLLHRWQKSTSVVRGNAPGLVHLMLEPVIDAGGGPHDWVRRIIDHQSPTAIEQLIAALHEWLPGATVPLSTAALDWDGVRALAAAGWDIGAHTTGHLVLTHLDSEGIRRDLRTCKATIEGAINRPVIHFAYCNGYYNDDVIAGLQRTGFVSAVTTEDRLNHRSDSPYRIARRVLWEGATMGASGLSDSLLSCQLDDTWSALGFNASEPGFRASTARTCVAAPHRKSA